MFSLDIVDSDAFLDMPSSSQNLYFHLGMRADDDGFVANPKKVMRSVNAQEDDYNLLLIKRFLIKFESGICVIKHWKMNNYIRADRYEETVYLDEKKRLKIKANGAYTELGIPNVNQTETEYRIEENNKEIDKSISSHVSQKKNMNTYNENNHSDSSEEVIDLDSGEKIVEKKKKGKSKSALQLCRMFTELAFEKTKKTPTQSGMYFIALNALKEITPVEAGQMILDWWEQDLPPEEQIQISRCLSPNQINKFKVK